MKNLLSLMFLGTLFMVLIGCPYDAKVGLNTYEESLKINKAYYGDFTADKDDGTKDKVQISKGEKHVYNIRHNTIDEKGQKMEYNYYRGYVTEIQGVQIVNVEKKDGNYNFYKFEWKNENELLLHAVGEEYVKANYSKAGDDDTKTLRAFIEEHIAKEGLFESPMTFKRD